MYAVVVCIGVASRAVGASAVQTGRDGPLITGHDFAGLDLPVEPQPGDAVFEARGGWAWAEGDARRLVLDDDVRVLVAGHEFRADRAVVWIEPRGVGVDRVWVLAVYFENVRTPLASARFSQSARRLLVTASVQGGIRLRAALVEHARPVGDALLAEGERRLAQRLTELIALGASLRPVTGFDPFDRAFAEAFGEPAPIDPDAPIFPDRGVVTFDAPNRTLITGETENALALTGGVAVEYTDLDAGRTLVLTARNAVVFLEPGSVVETLRAGPGEVRGVYLEGAVVATDGEFTVRGPRVYYDVANDRAVMLDAVFSTFDERRRLPLYVRAEVIRQEALGQWEAQRATISNVGFAEPHLSLGARSVRLTQTRSPDAPTRNMISARGVSLRLGRTPILPLPRYEGEFDAQRLPRLKVGTKDGDPYLSTRWDFASILGLSPDSPVQGDLLVDGYFARGPAGGVDLSWATPDAFGSILAYYIHDSGVDRLTTGADLAPPQRDRGLILAEHQWRLTDRWTLALQGSYISDQAFVDAFFEPIAEIGPETISRIALSRRGDHSLLLVEAAGTFNNFTPNEYLIQSRGYQTQRLPEVSFRAVGGSFFDGRVNYFGESRVGLIEPAFVEPSVRQFGFLSPAIAQAGFGLNPGQSIADALRAGGVREQGVARFDSRHELNATLDAGPVRVTPFAIGRVTAYGDDFAEFRAARGLGDMDSTRFWAALGATVSTAVTRVYDGVDSNLLDLHRLRHILEPSATVFTSTSSIDSEALPVFDETVESLAEGSVLRAGITSTWQTKRGGPGAWRNVDWLVVRAEYVYSTDDTTRESAVQRFFQTRPELSRLGEFAAADARLELTDAIGVVASGSYDVENDEVESASVGTIIDHGYGFTSFVEARRIDAGGIDSTFLNFGGSYELNARYALGAAAVLDLEDSSVEALQFEIRRRFPQWTLEVGVTYDDVREDVALSVQIRPWGGPRDRLRNSLTRERFFVSPASARGRAGSPYLP